MDAIAITIFSRQFKAFAYKFHINIIILQQCSSIQMTIIYLFNSQQLELYSSVRSMRLFACHGNAGTENIDNGCWKNAAAEHQPIMFDL